MQVGEAVEYLLQSCLVNGVLVNGVSLLDVYDHAEHLADSFLVAGHAHLDVVSVLLEELERVEVLADREDRPIDVSLGEEFFGHNEGRAFCVSCLMVCIDTMQLNIKIIL